MRVSPIAFALSGMAVGVAIWAGSGFTMAHAAGPDAGDPLAGMQIYADNCASCHGANLEGQDNWQSPDADGRLPAPPHDQTGHTWHHGDRLLFDYTKLGGAALMAQRGIEFDSGMPGFGEELTDAEISDVLTFIKSTWPDRIQKMQAERTQSEQQ